MYVKIFHDNLCGRAIRSNGKRDAAGPYGVLALRFIGERVSIVVLM